METGVRYLQVCGIFVAFIRSGLQLLQDPTLQFISISLEVLVPTRVLQHGLTVTACLLEGSITIEDLISTLLDILCGLEHLDFPRIPLPRVRSHLQFGLEKNIEKILVTRLAIRIKL